MKKNSIMLKDMAKKQLSGNYRLTILSYFLMELIISLPLQLLQSILNLDTVSGTLIYMAASVILMLMTAVFTLGQCYLYGNLANGFSCQLSDMWYGFRGFADQAIIAQLVIMLKTFAASLPFIVLALITAITKSYYVLPFVGIACVFLMVLAVSIQLTYSQTFFIMVDHPEFSASTALKESARMMEGHKLRFFYLQVSFLGMYLLGFLSLYVGFLWIKPYINMTKADFYMDLKMPQTAS